jgi:cell division septum initiation protein DivIVA
MARSNNYGLSDALDNNTSDDNEVNEGLDQVVARYKTLLAKERNPRVRRELEKRIKDIITNY